MGSLIWRLASDVGRAGSHAAELTFALRVITWCGGKRGDGRLHENQRLRWARSGVSLAPALSSRGLFRCTDASSPDSHGRARAQSRRGQRRTAAGAPPSCACYAGFLTMAGGYVVELPEHFECNCDPQCTSCRHTCTRPVGGPAPTCAVTGSAVLVGTAPKSSCT